VPGKPEELVNVPSDLTLVSDAELAELNQKVTAEFDRISALDVTPENLKYATELTDHNDRIRAETATRQIRARQIAEQTQAKMLEERETLLTRMHGPKDPEGNRVPMASEPIDAAAIAAAAAQGTMTTLVQLLGDRVSGRELTRVTSRPTLADAARYAPPANVPAAKLAVTARVDIPGVARDEGVNNLDGLVDIFQRKAKSMRITQDDPNYTTVATIRNEYQHTLDDRTPIGQVKELIDHLTSVDKQEALLAAGGWCAPSEIRYDFFNIACSSGLIDLPTFGVTRGGIRFPTSPSLADVFGGAFGGFSTTLGVTTNPWLWTEASDIAAVTGSPTKPCIRVPCPSFNEVRLECFGICLTAGNLPDDAYPENTANFLRLLLAAHEHAINGRTIAQMVALSSAAVSTGEFAATDTAVFQQVYGGISLAVTDYRARYGMCDDDILEVVAPYWLKAVIRADLAHRTGIEPDQVPDSQIVSWFTNLGVRVQWVNDWQVRGASQFGNATPMTAWPTSATVMVYAAGTFIKGNGLSLDLGVVRDSVLNATNDHTAAWSEECNLVARVGHESRQYTIAFNVTGRTGAANINAAAL
jgi:hypothetical protein